MHIFIFLLVTSAYGVPLPRRGLLQGVFALLARPPLPTSSVTPVVVPAVNVAADVESDVFFRTNMIARYLPIPRVTQFSKTIDHTPFTQDVIEDFVRNGGSPQIPRLRRLIEERNELLARPKAPPYFSGPSYPDRDQIHRIEAELRGLIDQKPWSTFDWKQVFAERLARAQGDVARELGVRPEQVYDLFENALALNPDDESNRHIWTGMSTDAPRKSVLRGLWDDGYNARFAPIYGTESLAALYRHLKPFAPNVVDLLSHSTEIEAPPLLLIQRDIAGATGAYFNPNPDASVRFWWGSLDTSITAHDLAPRYVAALDQLPHFRARIAALAPSRLRDAALTETDRQIELLNLELRTLPARLVAWRTPHKPAKAHHDPLWQPIDVAHAVTLADGATVPWLEHLRTLGVALQVADTLTGDAKTADAAAVAPEPCATRLAPATPPLALPAPYLSTASPTLVERETEKVFRD